MKFWSNLDKEKILEKLKDYHYGNVFTDDFFTYLNELDKNADEEIAVKNSHHGFHMHIRHTSEKEPKNTMFMSVDLQKRAPRMNFYQEREKNDALKPFGKGLFGYTHLSKNYLNDTWKNWIKDSYQQRRM